MPKPPRIICCYFGRFQPAGKHHAMAYNFLVSKFGKSNVYVCTSDKTEPKKSPFKFREKKELIKSIFKCPPSNIIQTRKNYSPDNVLPKIGLKPQNVIFHVAFGHKDLERIKPGPGKYFQNIPASPTDYKTSDENGYIVVVPTVNITIAGSQLSGTLIRSKLFQPGSTREERLNFWKEMTGLGEKTFDKYIQPKIKEGLIREGGNAGHMAHLVDDPTAKFSDLISFIKGALQGKLDVKEVTEKVDGQNAFISYINGEVRVARNKGTIKNFGAGSMDIPTMQKKWENAVPIRDAFVKSVQDLQSAFNEMNPDYLNRVFENGKYWLNIEIIYPASKNTLDYDAAYIIFHNLNMVDEDGNIVKTGVSPKKLWTALSNRGLTGGKTFEMRPPVMLKLNPSNDFSKKQGKYIADLKKIISKYKLKSSDSIGKMLEVHFGRLVDKVSSKNGVVIKPEVRNNILQRLAHFNKQAMTVGDLKKLSYNDKWTKDIMKLFSNQIEEHKKAMEPLSMLITKLGIEILSNINTYLSANPDKTVQTLRKDVEEEIKNIKKSNDPSAIAKMETILTRIKQYGGFDKILSATEGIVFKWRGKTFKITGAYADVNQLMGLVRYSR